MDLQDECCTKKRRVQVNVAEAVELGQEFQQFSDAGVNALPSSEVLVITDGDATTLATE